MSVFTSPSFDNHEHVVFHNDKVTGLRAIIAVHDTTLGPSLGGCRMHPYASEDEAIEDVLRLSRGMTYKAAVAGLNQGGGKAVIIGDPAKDKTPELLRAMGRFVETLGGLYVTAEDVGMSVDDVDVMSQTTTHIAGLGSGTGDPSPVTAWGTFHGIRAAIAHRGAHSLGRDSLNGLTVAVQGVGHVGAKLCEYLHDAGAKLIVCDVKTEAVQKVCDRFGARPVDIDDIYAVEADVFAPCALGATLNDETIPQLLAKVVAGAANNQLADDRHAHMLAKRGITYAPDFVVNAGGIIDLSYEHCPGGYDFDAAMEHSARIYQVVRDLLRRADADGVLAHDMAEHMAREALKRGPLPRLDKAG